MTEPFTKKQLEFLNKPYRRYNFLEGSVRSGKTYILYWLPFYLVEKFKHYEYKGVIAAKTLETLRENILDNMVNLFPGAVSYRDAGRKISICGHAVRGVGFNDESSKNRVQGSTVPWCVGDEIPLWPESAFMMLDSRLSVKDAMFFGSLNPDSPYFWLMTKYLNRENELDLSRTHFKLEDNTTLDPKYIEDIKKSYTGLWYRRYILGEWCAAEGAIYDMFDDSMIVDDPKEFPSYRFGIDYGTNNPFVIVVIGSDGVNSCIVDEFVYDSHKSSRQKTDEEYAKDLKRYAEKYNPAAIMIDPSAASFILAAQRAGIRGVIGAENEVLPGIQKIATALSNRRLTVARNCGNVINGFYAYSWDSKAQLSGLDKPLKVNDHEMDAVRYGFHQKKVFIA